MLAAFVLHAHAADVPPTCGTEDLACEEIVVSASRTEQARNETTAPVGVIDRAEIEASGATTVAELLRTVPGVQVVPTHGGDGLRLQGFDPQHSLVLVDGRPVAGRVDGTLDLSRLLLADVERIEIVPGPSSALYGSEALGGVVNIVSRRKAGKPRIDASLRVGSRRLAEGNAYFSAGNGTFSGGAGADVQFQDGYDFDTADVATDGDAIDDLGTRGWIRVRPPGAFTFEGDLAYRKRDRTGIDASATGAVFDRRTLEESADASLATQYWPGTQHLSRLQVAGTSWRQQALSDQRDSDVQDTYDETLDRRALAYFSYRWVTGSHVLVGGIDGTAESLDSGRLTRGTANRERLALYAQDDWRVLPEPRFSLSPGARVDFDTQFGVHGTPHLAARFDPVHQVSLQVSAGAGFRAPEFKELYLAFDHSSFGYVVEGNAALRPESSWGATSELKWRPAGPLSAGAGGWWHEVSNLIDVDLLAEGGAGGVATYTYVNINEAVMRGLTGSVGWDFAKPANIQASYTFTDARDRSDDAVLEGRARHTVAGSLTTEPLRVPVSLSVRGEWVGPRPFADDEGEITWTKPYLWVDSRLAWRVKAGFSLETGVKNLLDVRDQETLGLPPRTFYVGIHADGAPSLSTTGTN